MSDPFPEQPGPRFLIYWLLRKEDFNSEDGEGWPELEAALASRWGVIVRDAFDFDFLAQTHSAGLVFSPDDMTPDLLRAIKLLAIERQRYEEERAEEEQRRSRQKRTE